jgi:hypothetical protein
MIQLQPMACLCACTFLLFKKDTPAYFYKLVLGLKLG